MVLAEGKRARVVRFTYEAVDDPGALMVIVDGGGAIAVAINERFRGCRMLGHVEQHLDNGFDGIQVCRVDCRG